MKKLLVLLLAPVVLAGCSSVTNLTPGQAFRNAAGMYTVEFKWNTQRHAVQPESVKPFVIVGDESFPMQAVPYVKDRWETAIPVRNGARTIMYHYQVEYLVNGLGTPKQKTYISPEYQVDVVNKK